MITPKNLVPYFGFTEDEVRTQCDMHHINYEDVKNWYDGYLLGSTHIYNPKSVSDLLTWKEFQSYWTGTETYEALKLYINLNFDGLKESILEMLGNAGCHIDPTTFQNDMTTFVMKDDVLTLLVHLGYLTYDKKTEQVFIPNQEVAQEFLRAVKTGGWDRLMQPLSCPVSRLFQQMRLPQQHRPCNNKRHKIRNRRRIHGSVESKKFRQSH